MICLSFGNKDRKLLESIITSHEFIELRLDLCDFSEDELKFYLSKINKSIISFKGDENIAFPQLIKGIDYGACIVDIDFKYSKQTILELISYCRENKCQILLSYHELSHNLEIKYLKEIYNTMLELNPDFIKIVNVCKCFNDYYNLLELIKYTMDSNRNNTTIFALGEFSKISRVIAEYLKMPIIYTSLSEQHQTIDNQITYDNLHNIMEILK